MVFISRLERLETEDIHTQSFADDISILVGGKFRMVISERMQCVLNVVELWLYQSTLIKLQQPLLQHEKIYRR